MPEVGYYQNNANYRNRSDNARNALRTNDCARKPYFQSLRMRHVFGSPIEIVAKAEIGTAGSLSLGFIFSCADNSIVEKIKVCGFSTR